jgi:hypothetical protein
VSYKKKNLTKIRNVTQIINKFICKLSKYIIENGQSPSWIVNSQNNVNLKTFSINIVKSLQYQIITVILYYF